MPSLVAQRLKHLPGMRETWVGSLGREDPLEKEMATHSSTLAWRIPWREEPGRLQYMGSQRVWHDWAASLSLSYVIYWIKTGGHTGDQEQSLCSDGAYIRHRKKACHPLLLSLPKNVWLVNFFLFYFWQFSSDIQGSLQICIPNEIFLKLPNWEELVFSLSLFFSLSPILPPSFPYFFLSLPVSPKASLYS